MNDNPKAMPTRCLSQLEEMDIRLGKVNRNLSTRANRDCHSERRRCTFFYRCSFG